MNSGPEVVVEGPLEGGRRGRPFGAAMVDLRTAGYCEEEYVLSGEATRYRLVDREYRYDGFWTVEPAGSAPYRTRLLVRRPVDMSRFNGTVLLGWNNVSYGFETLDGENDETLLEGFAFVGVSAQRVGLHGLPIGDPLGLVDWDAERYGSLSIPSDDYCYDIFTQAAGVVGPGRLDSPDVLAGADVRNLVAWGRSQSAIRLASYYNAIQPLTQSFDGFLLEVYHGGGAMVSSLSPGGEVPEIPEIFLPVVNLLPYGSHLLRTDVAARAFVVNSETEATPYAKVRQDDTATYRLWEVAGAAHIGAAARGRSVARQQWEFGGSVPEPWIIPDDPNALSMDPVYDAALHHLQRWITEGTAPPSLPRIEVAGSPPAIVRDEHGNAVGGVRLPDLEVPVATHLGASEPGETPNLFGRSIPFGPEVLDQLYPDEETRRRRYAAAVRHAEAEGFILSRDAKRLLGQ